MAYISDTYTRQREARSICSKQSLQTQTHQRLKSLSVRSFILICRKSRRRRTRARESILRGLFQGDPIVPRREARHVDL